MLDLIRKHRNLFSLIFLVSAAGMVLTMFGNNPKLGGGMGAFSQGVVAKVEGEEIQTTELANALNQEMQEAEKTISAQVAKGGNNPEMRKMMENYIHAQVTPDRVLQSLVQRKFFVTTANHDGVLAPPDAVRDYIQNMPMFHNKDGRFDPLLYKESVAQPALFERDVSQQIKFDSLRGAFVLGLAVVAPTEVSEDGLLNQERVFETLSVNPREFPEPASVSPAEVATFVADPASKAKLQAYYDRHLRDYQSDEEIHAEHILIRDSEGGLKKIQDVLASIKSGKITFEAAAKADSSDKSNASKGGDLGYFGRGVMDPAFEKAAFDLKDKGQVSDPVKSSFGYHIIKLVDRKPAVRKTFEQAQSEIAPKLLLETRRMEHAQTWLKGWLAGGKVPSDKELKKLGFEWTKLPAWTPLSDKLGPLSSVESHLGELLSLNKDKPYLSQPLNQGESFVVVKWLETKPPQAPKELAAQATSSKAQEAFQFYLQNRYENLEKDKKIVRSEKILSQLRTQLGEPQG